MDPGKFALFGAAAMLGGVVRMAISLTFIIVEAAGVISFGPLLMFVFIISKYVADCFNEVGPAPCQSASDHMLCLDCFVTLAALFYSPAM